MSHPRPSNARVEFTYAVHVMSRLAKYYIIIMLCWWFKSQKVLMEISNFVLMIFWNHNFYQKYVSFEIIIVWVKSFFLRTLYLVNDLIMSNAQVSINYWIFHLTWSILTTERVISSRTICLTPFNQGFSLCKLNFLFTVFLIKSNIRKTIDWHLI